MSSEITGDGRALPVLWPVGALNQFQAAEFGIRTRADAIEQSTSTCVGKIHGAWHAITDPLKTCPIGHEGLSIEIKLVTPWIAEASEIDIQLQVVWAKVQHPTTVEPNQTMGCFQMAVNVDGLVHVELTIVPPSKGVEDMMRVLSAKSRENDATLISASITIGVLEVEQFGALSDVGTSIPRLNARWHEQTIGKDSGVIGHPIPIGIFHDQYLVFGSLSGLDLRVESRSSNPQTSFRVKIDLDGLADEGCLRPKGHFDLGCKLKAIGRSAGIAIALSRIQGSGFHRSRLGEPPGQSL